MYRLIRSSIRTARGVPFFVGSICGPRGIGDVYYIAASFFPQFSRWRSDPRTPNRNVMLDRFREVDKETGDHGRALLNLPDDAKLYWIPGRCIVEGTVDDAQSSHNASAVTQCTQQTPPTSEGRSGDKNAALDSAPPGSKSWTNRYDVLQMSDSDGDGDGD